jgi:DNA polymerase-3 subunit gamma/tau
MVFYRKYRPQTIEELDSEAVKQALRNVLSIENVPHAFLFTGPKGLGKTSTARIVAKYVNCEQTEKRKGKLTKQELIPCNQCDSCIGITQGTNLDVLEIDAASNRV